MTRQDSDRRQEWLVDASTVILVRQGQKGPKVYLVARTSSASSFAGAHVFPGGVVDKGDGDPDLLELSRTPDVSGLEGFIGRMENPYDVFFCALRETFEESGVLLASGLPQEGVRALWEHRPSLVEGKISLAGLARDNNLRLQPDRLAPFGRWITPLAARKRFDTRFFLARLPQGQEPDPDEGEVTRGLWLRPQEALEQYARGKLNLMPPTFMNLMALSGKKDVDEVFAEGRGGNIQPVMPEPFVDGDAPALLLPHDPDYSNRAFKQPAQPGASSRVVMDNGRWKAVTS